MPIFDLILYVSLFISLFFEIFLLITYFEVKDEIKFEREHVGKNISNFPSVTIIVPCFNEEHTVVKTVHSLLELDYPRDRFSLIIVDDGSTDNTQAVLQQFKDNPQIKIYSKENEGSKFAALNFALEKVESDLVGCLDADSFVAKDALRKIVPFFDVQEIMAVTPSIKVYEPKTILQHVQKVEYSWGIFLRRLLSSMNALYVTPGPFSIFRTKVFRDLGGYRHAHHTEDMELALRMHKHGYRITNSHGAHVYTVAPGRFKALYKQRVRWTYGFLNNTIDYRNMLFNKKYGNIGMFILPIASFSMFSTLYAAGNFIWAICNKAIESISRIQTVGFGLRVPSLSFDWFFVNTNITSVIGFITIVFTLILLFLALRMANGKFRINKELAYYLCIYIFIVPIWLAKAVYSTLFGKKVTWR